MKVGETDSGSLIQAYTYDSVGNRTSIVDADGRRWTFTYDPANQTQTVQSVTGKLATLAYDPNGNQTVVSSPNIVTTMGYDKENRMLSSVTEATFTTYTYGTNSMKFTEQLGMSITTLIWDGTDYLQGRSKCL